MLRKSSLFRLNTSRPCWRGLSGVVEGEKEKAPFDSFIKTDVDSIYTSSQLDGNLSMTLDNFKVKAKNLFSLPTRYVHPKEFKYALPTSGVPEFAFIGRSNVGKSSLVGRLLNNPKIVKISKTPGATRSVNYFSFGKFAGDKIGMIRGAADSAEFAMLNKPEMYLVDLPGYGFAKSSRSDQAQWKDFIQGYFQSRDASVLRRVYILVDTRRGLKKSDVEMMQDLNRCALPYQVVLTKSDAANALELHHALRSVFAEVMGKKGARQSSCLPFVHVTSSKTKDPVVTVNLNIGASAGASDSDAGVGGDNQGDLDYYNDNNDNNGQQQQKQHKENGIDALRECMSEMVSHEWRVRKRAKNEGPVAMTEGVSPQIDGEGEEEEIEAAEEQMLDMGEIEQLLLAQGVPAEQIADITARFMDQIQDDGDVDDCDDEDGE